MNQMPRKKIDTSLLFGVLCLLAFGLVMIYSTTIMKQGSNVLKLQMAYIAASIIIVRFLFEIPLWWWAKFSKPLFIVVTVLLVIAGFSRPINGASRWIHLPFFNIQPSELFKFWVILYIADFFQRRSEALADVKRTMFVGILPTIGVCVTMFLTKDLGSSIVVLAILAVMLYLVKIPIKLLFKIGMGALPIIVLFMVVTGRFNRFFASMEPFDDPYGRGAQTIGSLLSINSGGFLGSGLGNGIFKNGFLPESHNDFIFAVITDELGWIGAIILVITYVWLCYRIVKIAATARNLKLYFNSFVGFGISILIAMQCLVHVGANFSVLPNKGLTLPFISYGGSSTFVMILCLMFVLRIDYENRQTKLGYDVSGPKSHHFAANNS